MIYRYLLFFLVISSSAFSQTMEQNRKYYGDKSAENIEGSPFLFDDFRSANIIDKAGKIYKDQMIKYNLYTQEVVFKDEFGELKKFASQPDEVQIKGYGILKNGFSNPLFGNTNTLYEVLFKDKLELLKLKVIHIEDGTVGYNDAHPPRKYVADTRYFLIVDNKWTDVTKARKNFSRAFGSKESLVNDYISKNKLNLTKQDDLISAITYANTLF